QGQGSATVTEATAVAAGSIRPKGRRVVVVADIGGGTSDFGAFITGLPGRNVLAGIKGTSAILRQAGDYLDMQLNRLLLNKAGLVPGDPAARGLTTAIRVRQRSLKETLFNSGRIAFEAGDVFFELTAEEFLADKLVQDFAAKLREKFYIALDP